MDFRDVGIVINNIPVGVSCQVMDFCIGSCFLIHRITGVVSTISPIELKRIISTFMMRK
jgi:hypothetical protein